jgi:prophage regulatory protein
MTKRLNRLRNTKTRNLRSEAAPIEPLMDPVETAATLNVAPATLAKWRCIGMGPRWIRVGRLPRYRPRDVEEWLTHQEAPADRKSIQSNVGPSAPREAPCPCRGRFARWPGGRWNRPLSVFRLRAVTACTGLSRSTMYRRMIEGTFPKAMRLGPRSVGWLESEIHEWLSQCIQQSRKTAD